MQHEVRGIDRVTYGNICRPRLNSLRMGGKKGGGGKGKKKELEEKDVLTEVDREYYELQLVDLNKKLSRLRTRTSELEASNTSLEEELRTLDEDRSDIIAYLKKTLLTKSDEMTEVQERLDGLKQAMESGEIMYKEKINQMEQDFKNMHEELTSEIKLLQGKLNSLEEFRTQRDELMSKFASQEERMAEMEEQRQRTLYEAERRFVIEKDKLKKQMETRLLQLSQQFQEATDVRIASTTHRMIRENIAVNNELDIMQEVQKKMLVSYDEMKQKVQDSTLQVRLREEERDEALRKSVHQKSIIDKFKMENEELQMTIKNMEDIKKENETLQEKYKEMSQVLEDTQTEMKIVSKRYADGQTNSAKLYADVAALKVSGRRLYGLLHKAVTAVQEALRIKEEPGLRDPALVSFRRDHLLLNLLELLNRATLAEKERYVLSREQSLQSYSQGDLGLIPKSEE